MRQLALIGLALAALLAGTAVFDTVETISHRREAQDRSLQAAVAMETGRVISTVRQDKTGAAQMLVNPAISELLVGGRLPQGMRRRDTAAAAASLAAFEATALVPLSSSCIDDAEDRQLACGPAAAHVLFPAALRKSFGALAAQSPDGAATIPFKSPLAGGPTVAYVAPLRRDGRLLGVVHFDVATARTLGSSLITNNVAGVTVTLGGYLGGRLILAANAKARAEAQAVAPPEGGRAAPAGQPAVVVGEGHRAIVVPLPLRIGSGHVELAILARVSAPNPGFLNAWRPGMVAVLVLALFLLAVSTTALAAANRRLQRELGTDALTGLRNRRALMEDLPRVCQRASDAQPAFLWLFDLDGFKSYNDAFGHLAGDALLSRFGERLNQAVGGDGTVYRLGGDEFCVLLSAPQSDPHGLFQLARGALVEQGGAFSVTASAGAVEIPSEAGEPTAALRLADQHMYRDKAGSRGGAAELVTAVLHAALAQRHPELDEHSSDVAGDVEVLARSVGLDEETVEMIVMAGDLHDVGKLGIPDEIISNPGPLNAVEWEFMRQHTVMGARIIAAAGPSLERIAPLVRASHERWDGNGYPDGLAGEEIPLGARIITICDSFRAMLSERPYKRPMSLADALAEIRRCSGTQFDPRLVEVFCRVVAQRTSTEPEPRPAPDGSRAPTG